MRGSGVLFLATAGPFSALRGFPLATDRAPMNTERARKRLDRRKEPLLKTADQQAGSSLCASRFPTESLLPDSAVFIE